MTQLPPFRTRQSAPPLDTDEDDDALPLLGEDAILERGAPDATTDAPQDDPPWDLEDVDDDVPTLHVEHLATLPPEPEDEAVTELLRDLNDVVPAATLAGAWSAQYEASHRATGSYVADGAPPVLTDVLVEAPPPAMLGAPAGSAGTAVSPEAAAIPQAAEAPWALARAESDDALADTGLTASDEALAERIADSVMAALQPSLRDTVLDAVRDTLAAARRQP